MSMKKKAKPTAYYAVHKGRSVGVFTDWDVVKKLVDGFNGPKQKKFKSKEDAEYFVKYGEVPCKVDPKIPIVYNDLTIFTDGSHSPVTNKTAIGIAFSRPYHPYNYNELLPENTTNQKAELYAIAKALEILTCQIQQTHDVSTIEIWTDSDYSVKSVYEYSIGWVKNGWIASTGEKVKYRKHIEYVISQLKELPNCKLRHIKELGLKSHKSKPHPDDIIANMVWEGNNVADDLARSLTL